MLRFRSCIPLALCALALLSARAEAANRAGPSAEESTVTFRRMFDYRPAERTDLPHSNLSAERFPEIATAVASVSQVPIQHEDYSLQLTDEEEVFQPTESWSATTSNDLLTDREEFVEISDGEPWRWQWAPNGLIYHSYLAGPHEPHMSLVTIYTMDNRALWDATLGARVGIVRYGDRISYRPQGYQLDFYGAAISRLDLEHREDLVATDYVFGFPITYGVNDWQFKFGYAHTSSHLGDEYAIRNSGSLARRINYVRDGFVLGASHYPYPFWRQYSEVGWAFNADGGAEPFEAQFGAEFSAPGPTGCYGSPYLAVNGHLREEHDFGGDFAVQTGWLRRGEYGQTFRVGVHFFTGKSSQYQFFDNSEEQIGLGVWYDH